MTNEVFNDYIERKKECFDRLLHRKVSVEFNQPEYARIVDVSIDDIKDFLSDMAKEMFNCLPKEKDPLNPDTVLWRERAEGHNSCRSTFLENIKKLK